MKMWKQYIKVANAPKKWLDNIIQSHIIGSKMLTYGAHLACLVGVITHLGMEIHEQKWLFVHGFPSLDEVPHLMIWKDRGYE